MKRLTYLFMICALPVLCAAQNVTPTANVVLQNFLSMIDNRTLSADFTLTVTDNGLQPISYTGNVQMRGEKFRLSMLGNEGAYDGKTYYLYSQETDELTLTTPSRAELVEANPILFAQQLQRLSIVRFSPAKQDNRRYFIELVPTNEEAGVEKFILTLRKGSLEPEEIVVKEPQNTTRIVFSNVVYSPKTPSFVINMPGAFVNDLR